MPSTKWPGVGESSLRRARRIRAHKDEPRALLEAHFEERAAIFELDEDLPRAEAEAMARREMAAGIRKRAQAEHDATPYTSAVAALSAKCLAYVPEDRWRQAVEDATAFVSEWGARAQAFGWTARELFGLHTPPEWPHPTYSTSRPARSHRPHLVAARPAGGRADRDDCDDTRGQRRDAHISTELVVRMGPPTNAHERRGGA